MNANPANSDQYPVQQTGSYRAWALEGCGSCVIDLAWHSRIGHETPERHALLPFTEPSLALRRRFDRRGETSDWDFVIFRAQPDGGTYAPSSGEELFALRLAPEFMESALRLSLRDHLAADCEVPQLLLAQLGPAARLADRGQFGEAWRLTASTLAAAMVETDRITHAAAIVRQGSRILAPGELASEVGLSARHMRRGFLDRFGLSPRAFVRRQRLTLALLEAERSAKPDWADLAAAFRFSDQAHLIRECRALTGTSPVHWHRQRRALAVSFNT